jgi:hypothetical protein
MQLVLGLPSAPLPPIPFPDSPVDCLMIILKEESSETVVSFSSLEARESDRTQPQSRMLIPYLLRSTNNLSELDHILQRIWFSKEWKESFSKDLVGDPVNPCRRYRSQSVAYFSPFDFNPPPPYSNILSETSGSDRPVFFLVVPLTPLDNGRQEQPATCQGPTMNQFGLAENEVTSCRLPYKFLLPQ